MIKIYPDYYEVYVPNLCGGETRLTFFKTNCPDGNIENIELLKQIDNKQKWK